MSVIAAFAGVPGARVPGRWLETVLASFHEVAPDARGSWIGDRAGLAHAALHTSIDTPSAQPLALDRGVHLVADVRLDDRDAVRHAVLGAGGRLPHDADDARQVLEAWSLWGERTLERLAGDFALVVWDARSRRLMCARDPFGIVPLYYAVVDDGVLVSNALQALRMHPAVPDTLDRRGAGDFLLMGFDADPAGTIFAGIRQLPPGHLLSWQDGRVTVRRWWEPPQWTGFLRYRRPAEYVEHFRTVLRDAVADRARCGALGVQLSGGLDSTAVASLAHALTPEDGPPRSIRAYTATVRSIMPDREGEYAALVARHLGIEHREIDVAAFPDIDLFDPESVRPLPGMFRRTAMERELVRQPARHASTVLTGLGGDVLLGYSPAFWLDWVLRGEPRRAVSALASHVRAFRTLPLPGVRSALRARAARAHDRLSVPVWIADGFAREEGLQARFDTLRAEALHSNEPAGLSWRGWPSLLASGHPGFTGAPVRFRHPFYDERLLRLALAIPPRPWFDGKRLLREATRGLLPDAVRERPKTPMARGTGQALHAARGAHPAFRTLIASTPSLDGFLDRERLIASLDAESAVEPRQVRRHLFALGFAHWLYHHSRPSVRVVEGHTRPEQAGRRVAAAR